MNVYIIKYIIWLHIIQTYIHPMTYICLDLNQLHMEMMNSLAPVIVLASFPHLFVSALTQILLYN